MIYFLLVNESVPRVNSFNTFFFFKGLGNSSQFDAFIGNLSLTLNGLFLNMNMNRMTWMDANKDCMAGKLHLVGKHRLSPMISFAWFYPKAPPSMELDVWIDVVSTLDKHIVQSE